MEISIKWNICRICLQEERVESQRMRPIFNEARLVKQIKDCAGIELCSNDGLPEKICRKCLLTLRYAVSFRSTCRKSDEYLRSVMQKAKEATILDHAENDPDLDDVIEEIDDESNEYIYVIADLDEKMMRSTNTEVDGTPTEHKSKDTSRATVEEQIGENQKYNLIDLTKNEEATTRNDNCYKVEIMPVDPLTSIPVEDEEDEKMCIKKEYNNSSENNEKSVDGYLSENEMYSVHETQEEEEEEEDAETAQNEDSEYSCLKLRISNDSEEEYILDADDLPYSSSDEMGSKAKIVGSKNFPDKSVDKKIIPTKNETACKICDHCGNTFSSIQSLRMHIRKIHNERSYECELCGKRFASPSNLSAHIRTHTGERRYECQYCHRRFTDRSTHIKHERIHTNEKPFKCGICQKAFSLSTSLKAHLRIHTGEKPFECKPCNKAFKLPHQLKAHLSTQLHKLVTLEGREKEHKKN